MLYLSLNIPCGLHICFFFTINRFCKPFSSEAIFSVYALNPYNKVRMNATSRAQENSFPL